MQIDGWDISNADARQWKVTPGFHSVKNDSDWTRGSPVPILLQNDIGFATLKIVLLIKNSGGRQSLLDKSSLILSKLLGPVTLTLDNFSYGFYGVMTKHSLDEKAMLFWHQLTIELEGCKISPSRVVQTFSGTSFTVANTGNIVTPAVIEVTPQIGAASIVLTGICRDPFTGADLPVTVRELTTGNTVTLDGETGLFTQGGSLKGDIDIWALPTLLPGSNNITVDNSRMSITVKYYPRYM